MTTAQPKPRRRFFRYSLRTLMLVVTVFCIWMGITAKRARDQKQAVDAILEEGGRVRYEHEIEKSDPPGPEWFRQLIGDEYFFSVYAFSLRGSEVNDASLVAIGRLADLNHLRLNDTQVTDAGLVHLSGLTNLNGLSLYRTNITDAGLEHLENSTNLRMVLVRNTLVTDEGMRKLQRALPNCGIFYIDKQGKLSLPATPFLAHQQ